MVPPVPPIGAPSLLQRIIAVLHLGLWIGSSTYSRETLDGHTCICRLIDARYGGRESGLASVQSPYPNCGYCIKFNGFKVSDPMALFLRNARHRKHRTHPFMSRWDHLK